jgi:hypothetical protein
VTENVPFEPKEPHVQLFLFNNQLKMLPGAIFEIENITLLSLRGNGLTELPPAIGKLKNLRTLNLAQNRLKYLPGALLEIIGSDRVMEEFIPEPNPFLLPDQPRTNHEMGHSFMSKDEFWEICDRRKEDFTTAAFVARSPIQYLDVHGRSYSDFEIPSDPAAKVPVEDSLAPTPSSSASQNPRPFTRTTTATKATKVPPLTELALRSCAKSSQLQNLPELLPDSYSHVRRLLEHARTQREAGGETCASCQKSFVTPATQWLEFWHLEKVRKNDRHSVIWMALQDLPGKTLGLPFMMRGCSWPCLPQEIEPDTAIEDLRYASRIVGDQP